WTRRRPWVISAVVGSLLLVTSCLASALWAHARQMRAEALYFQVRATRLELQTGAVPENRRDQLLNESRQRLREATRAAGPFLMARLYDEALALLQLEGRACRCLVLSETTARQLKPDGTAQVSADGKLILFTGKSEALVLDAETGKILHTARGAHAAL